MNAPPWTIDELGAQVALALSVDYEGAGSGRVRDVPDRRTIRYYTTLGLLDRPAEMRGRTALYSRRHLLQLVAIKRLQAKGRSLVQLQAEVVGRSNAQLQRIAKLTDVLEDAAPPEAARRAAAFWSEPPAPVAAEANPELNPPAVEPVLLGVALPEGVTLLVPALRGMEADDVEALRVAAQPLLNILRRRRLLPGTERTAL